jgi:RecJ-like exonuclease
VTSACPGCNGTGMVLVDCSYCRISEEPDNEELKAAQCTNCQNKGAVEDMCPVCSGTGMILERDSILKV